QGCASATGPELPARQLRSTVPARVQPRHPAVPPPHEPWRLTRMARPREAQDAVVLPPAGEPHVEAERAVASELGDVGPAAPAEQRVAVREHLHAAHEVRDEAPRTMGVLTEEPRVHPLVIEADDQAARLRLDLRRGPVVEDADLLSTGERAGVVLPREDGAGPHPEVALAAAEAPEHAPGGMAQLVDGPGGASRDDQVAVVGDVDRVDVEVVELRTDPRVRLRGVDVVEASPLEEHPRARDRELLDDAADDARPGASAEARQVPRRRVPGGDEGGPSRRDQELVQV